MPTPAERRAELALYRAHWERVRAAGLIPNADSAALANAKLAAHWIRNVDRAAARVREPELTAELPPG